MSEVNWNTFACCHSCFHHYFEKSLGFTSSMTKDESTVVPGVVHPWNEIKGTPSQIQWLVNPTPILYFFQCYFLHNFTSKPHQKLYNYSCERPESSRRSSYTLPHFCLKLLDKAPWYLQMPKNWLLAIYNESKWERTGFESRMPFTLCNQSKPQSTSLT